MIISSLFPLFNAFMSKHLYNLIVPTVCISRTSTHR